MVGTSLRTRKAVVDGEPLCRVLCLRSPCAYDVLNIERERREAMTHDKWIKLTPEQQRIKVAECCSGITVGSLIDRRIADPENGYPYSEALFYDIYEWLEDSDIPDYLHDLNACHEIVNNLTDIEYNRYDGNLRDVVRAHDSGGMLAGLRMMTEATAAQRCEAFVLTMEREVPV